MLYNNSAKEERRAYVHEAWKCLHDCETCGKTFSIKDVDTSSIPHPNGFVVEETNYVMTGLCPACAKK